MNTMNTMVRSAAILLLTLWASVLLAAEQLPRPEKCTMPVSSQHLKDFYKLNDKVYRPAQPDRKAEP